MPSFLTGKETPVPGTAHSCANAAVAKRAAAAAARIVFFMWSLPAVRVTV